MFCDNCGAVVESNSKFCDSCGKALGLSVTGGNPPGRSRTAASCPLCGREALLDGYSVTIAGVVLVHVCADCCELCSKDPKRIVDEHRDVFEKMLAERRESLSSRPGVSEATSDGSRRLERERSLVKRYDDAYRVAKTIVIFGDTIKGIGVILTLLIAIGTMVIVSQPGRGSFFLSLSDRPLLIGGFFFAAIVGVSCYAAGTLVAALGQNLKANLDCAVNSSPFLTDELRAEVMSIAGGHLGDRVYRTLGL